MRPTPIVNLVVLQDECGAVVRTSRYCRPLLDWTAPPPLLYYLSSRPYLTMLLCSLATLHAHPRRTPLLRQDTALSFGISVLSRATSRASLHSDFDNYFASSGFSCVHQMEEAMPPYAIPTTCFFRRYRPSRDVICSIFTSPTLLQSTTTIWVRLITRSRRSLLPLALYTVSPIS